MIDTKALRKKVIDLAIQGKLTEQLPSDGDAETLYAQIQEEKAKLIKEGKLKKEKSLPPISDNEILFDIPSNWKWVHLNTIATSSLGKTLNKSTDKGDEVPYLCSINVYWEGIKLDSVKKAKFDEASKANYRLQKGDLLICEGGDSGRSTIWNHDEEMYYQNALHRVRFYGNIKPEYFCLVLEYYKKSGIINRFTTGIGIQHLVQSSLNAMWLPLPPLAEQKRIVEKLDTVFEQIDIIDTLQQQYEADLSVLKGKIIDAGIRGKLTEQLPEDGTAEELLKHIREKKDQMIKEGLIPKESKSQIINDEDKIFDVPKNWAYARVQDVATYITDYVANGSFATLKANTTTYKNPNYAVFVRTLDLGAEFKNDLSYIDEASYEFLKKSKLYGGELILPNIGASIGKAFIMPDLGMPMSLAPNSVMIKFENATMNKYFYYVFQSSYGKGILMNIQGGAATPKFSKTDLRKMVVMLPPLAEQERIVNKIEEIFELL